MAQQQRHVGAVHRHAVHGAQALSRHHTGDWQYMADSPYQQYLKNANQELAHNIIAALKLGDIYLIEANLEWIQGLLVNYHFRMPKNVLKAYFEKYRQATFECLDERGQIILDWLDKFQVN